MLDLNVKPLSLLYVRAAVLDEKNALYENIGEVNFLLKGAGLLSLSALYKAVKHDTAAFAFGLFIFQALFMKGMMGGTYPRAVRNSFIPEWFSMNMMAAGMFPVMIFLMMGRDMRAMQPTEPLFWGVMSLGVIVGFATAYPVNVWMVSRNLKHGLMHVDAPSGSVAEPGVPANAPAKAPSTGAAASGHGSRAMGGR